MKISYARTSTFEQIAGFETQLRDLETAGCEKIFREQLSSVAAERGELEAALEFIREGDELMVTKIDRLARSVADLLHIVERVKRKKAILDIGNLGRINGDPTSTLLLNVIGAFAQFEREMMLERQREDRQGQSRGQVQGPRTNRARQGTSMPLIQYHHGMTDKKFEALTGPTGDELVMSPVAVGTHAACT
jgi:DNA invertase Pin-like site-specific DNA recombinase